jgi:MFS family permease
MPDASPAAAPIADAPRAAPSIETRQSWLVATAVMVILTFSYGAPMVAAVALKEIAADLGGTRTLAAMAVSLAWLGFGFGSIVFGRLADRIGYRWVVAIGGVGIGAGLAMSAAGGSWQLLAGHALLVGGAGWGAINVTLMVYVSRWFDRRRGAALAYVTSGQYIAGLTWPLLIAIGLQHWGWRPTMLWIGLVSAVVIIPMALIFLTPAPAIGGGGGAGGGAAPAERLRPTGFSTPTAYALLTIAGFLCCVPMSMPPAHVVAMCSDLGLAPTHGALMLSVLLGSAMLSRQGWGWLADRIGSLKTILAGSIAQSFAIVLLVLATDEIGVLAASAAFGLGYSGIIPAYVLAVREMFRADEASWRVPVWFFVNVWGMAMGGWLGGAIYDLYLSYQLAFLVGLAFNIANIVLVAWLVMRQRAAETAQTAAVQSA